LSGTIESFNEELDQNPELVNSDPYGAGWMIKMSIDNLDEIEELLDVDAYKALVGA
jgi:glycine cleavage system H protein